MIYPTNSFHNYFYSHLWFLFSALENLQEILKIKTLFILEKQRYIPHYWSDKGLKDTTVNQACSYL